MHNEVRAVPGDKLSSIKSPAEWEKELKEAAEKEQAEQSQRKKKR
jgi:hypothetical protein